MMDCRRRKNVSLTTVNGNGTRTGAAGPGAPVTGDAGTGDARTGDARGQRTGDGRARTAVRRTELAAFLRSRRERISPEDVGLPAGTRRRTAGLRREELAQLAGVGVTWYTWLEQGRPINASVQVLDALARTLRLDATERGHLFRLADVPGAAGPADCPECPLPPEVQRILDAVPYPASVTTERFDLLAWNQIYAALFPGQVESPPSERNTLLSCLTGPSCCGPVPPQVKYPATLIAQLRNAYGKHVGDPAWTHFIHRLEAASPKFAAIWAAHDVAQPVSHTKRFRHPTFGVITAKSTSFAVNAVPGARMVIYTPDNAHSEEAVARLAAGEGLTDRFPCWGTHDPQRLRLALAP
jgi:transcriptional regulator with XRE-family HTH domain